MDMTLLIVDDEENILSRIEKYIRNNMTCFSEIYTAQNGAEALDIIFRFKPDVMLLDVQIPVKNGLEVMEEALEKGEISNLRYEDYLSLYEELKEKRRY